MQSVPEKSAVSKEDLLRGPPLARLTLPSDANIYGNVHGGTILKLMEEAGSIVATRYCNKAIKRTEPCYAVLVRIERMDFLLPMKIGEVAELTNEIVFTSPHSLLVEIEVFAEDVIKGVRRKTNRGRFWYVPINQSDTSLEVPQMDYKDDTKRRQYLAIYNEQKLNRNLSGTNLVSLDNTVLPPIGPFTCHNDSEKETVEYSRCCLSFLVGKNDASLNGYCRGGVLLKLMDECAGIVSAKHCRTNVVTACLHATNFHRMIKLGSLVTVNGRVTFTSNRSLEVEVVVLYEIPFEASFLKQKAIDAYFTYVSIDSNGKALPVPALKIKSEVEQKDFNEGLKRYEIRKKEMLGKK